MKVNNILNLINKDVLNFSWNNLYLESNEYITFSKYIGLSGKYPWERYETPYPPSNGLNSTTTVHLGEWLWHYITYKGWYAIKQRN